MAANQIGKTVCGGAEWSFHLTGRYPDWWDGAEFKKPVRFWVGGVTGESTRDNPQRILIGQPEIKAQWGTGMIPKECLLEINPGRGLPNAVDSLVVRWGGGGDVQAGSSSLLFKSYEKGREKWQGDTIDGVWFDEEPSMKIYSEGRTRTNNGQLGNFCCITFTPLLGMSEVVRQFLSEEGENSEQVGRFVVKATIDDAVPSIYTREQADSVLAGYPAHEREARAKGVPTLGSGRIFPVSSEDIEWEVVDLPGSFVWIGGLDFGWDHPTAAVKCAWDRDADVFYVVNAYKRKQQTPLIHSGALKPWGGWLPWAWPHDGLQHDKGSGVQLAESYRRCGLNLLPDHATFEDGSNGVEAGLMEMLDAMQTSRFKVAKHLVDWYSEFNLYHRKDGKVVKEFDDLMSATRYAWMMRREAVPSGGRKRGSLKYNLKGYE